jgi:ABC-type nitrate/sulfonate/bicarbonate transport system substrate-binding protein
MVPMRRIVLFVVLCAVLGGGTASAVTLRMSLPPVFEALPIAFAEAWGLFDAEGISVELVGITDNQERSTALLTGNLDAVMGDVSRSLLDCSSGRDLVITGSAASTPQTDSVLLGLLSHVGFGAETLDALLSTNGKIGISYRTDDEYMLDQLLMANGIAKGWSLRYMYFNDALQLAVWFAAQTVPVAVMREPYISYIATYHPPNGSPPNLTWLSTFSGIVPLPSVVVFRKAFVKTNAAAVEAFYRAYAVAVERINAMPRDELVEVGLDVVLGLFFQGANVTGVPQEALDAISIPHFEAPAPLTEETFSNVLSWMQKKGYVIDRLEYGAVVDNGFLP